MDRQSDIFRKMRSDGVRREDSRARSMDRYVRHIESEKTDDGMTREAASQRTHNVAALNEVDAIEMPQIIDGTGLDLRSVFDAPNEERSPFTTIEGLNEPSAGENPESDDVQDKYDMLCVLEEAIDGMKDDLEAGDLDSPLPVDDNDDVCDDVEDGLPCDETFGNEEPCDEEPCDEEPCDEEPCDKEPCGEGDEGDEGDDGDGNEDGNEDDDEDQVFASRKAAWLKEIASQIEGVDGLLSDMQGAVRSEDGRREFKVQLTCHGLMSQNQIMRAASKED